MGNNKNEQTPRPDVRPINRHASESSDTARHVQLSLLAVDLLDKYNRAATDAIWNYSSTPNQDIAELSREVEIYRTQIKDLA